jgi:two-component system, NtrC family, response regulator AtoC
MRPVALLYMDESPLFQRIRQVLRECGVVGVGSSHEAEAVDWVTRPGMDVVIRAGACPSAALHDAARNSGVDVVSLHAQEAGADAALRDLSPGDEGRLQALLAELPQAARQRRQEDNLDELIGRSDPILDVVEQLLRMAPSHAPILITGESGTGKGLAAAAIHDRSRHAEGPLVAVNCGAIPPNLIESHLFGHEKGSFTGAQRRHAGCFEQAANGTLFLDEIAELPLEAQVKLLRVLESGEVTRVGGERPIPLHCRVVTATNLCPEGAVRSGRLREDLFYRLGVLRLNLPPLRDRKGDIPDLAVHFARLISGKEGLARRLSRGALDRLVEHPWPGNVRELRNALHSAVILAPGPIIGEEDLPLDRSPPALP